MPANDWAPPTSEPLPLLVPVVVVLSVPQSVEPWSSSADQEPEPVSV